MKKILMLLLLALPLSISAQKFAHFDYAAVMQALPEYKTAQTEMEALGKTYQTELESMQNALQTEYEKLQKEINEQTPESVRTRRVQAFQDMQQKFEQAQQDFSQEFQEAQQKKMEPITKKVMDAVEAVAKEGAYVYIMDATAAQQAGIFINLTLAEDVTAKVKAKLNVQ